MSDKLTPFQIAIFAVLIVAIVAGVIIFAAQRSTGNEVAVPITMWGTLGADHINKLQDGINDEVRDSVEIIYTELPADTFEETLVEALASGTGPDTVLFPSELFVRHENKMFLIEYQFYPQTTFQSSFVEAGEFLLRETGVVGFPFTIDPLVLYWNRTILNNEGIALPPEFWDEFIDIIPSVTVSDTTGNITRSGVAMGEFRNVLNAKPILLSLIQQAGNDIVVWDSINKEYSSILEDRLGFKLKPGDAAVNFFVQFSNPTKSVYSWNKSLPQSDEFFLSGDLAFYIGYASEREKLLEKNPNLNFGVSPLPQSKSSEDPGSSVGKSVSANMHFIGIMKDASNIAAAFDTILKITSPDNIEYLDESTGLPSVRRERLGSVPEIAHLDVFNKSAIISKVFLDPDTDATNDILQSMIESVVIGTSETSAAVDRASREIDALFR